MNNENNHLLFTNPGALEIDLVKLLGVSVKDSDSPIGFFGTGLKYAMAAALRFGGSLTLVTDGRRYEVGSKPLSLRGKDFTQVTLDGEPLGFTTELGKQWEPWMVVRELYSNALDEAGTVTVASGELNPEDYAGKTAIALHGDAFLKVWERRRNYFLQPSETRRHSSPFVDAFEAYGEESAVFYRGVRVATLQKPTLHRYNLAGPVFLTEDRTLLYAFQLEDALEKAIITSQDASFVRQSLTADSKYYERSLTFNDPHSRVEPSEQFKQVCAQLDAQRPDCLNTSAIHWYRKRTESAQPLRTATLTAVQRQQLDRALAFVGRLGFASELDLYPLEVVDWLGENVFGQAVDGRMYVAKGCFDKGTKFLAATLLEELVHCHFGFNDCTREMQNWLFDRVITMGEELAGEAL
jgi:hypothetical protein